MDRRQLLKMGALRATGLAGAIATGAPIKHANAADYKALVCIYLHGGNDGMNMVIPTDQDRYSQYANTRAQLAIPQSTLIPITSTTYGFHPAMSSLKDLIQSGKIAPIFNVGPLKTPLTKAQYTIGPTVGAGGPVPDSLFSHSSQEMLWQTAAADALQLAGWGARASDILGTAHPVIAIGDSPRFGISSLRTPLSLAMPGEKFGAQNLPTNGGTSQMQARRAVVDAMLAESDTRALYAAEKKIVVSALQTAARIGSIVESAPNSSLSRQSIDSAFARVVSAGTISNQLAAQLYQIAKLIFSNAIVGGTRQIFYASLGGFDTHGDQVLNGNSTLGKHADLLTELSDAISCFVASMDGIGMGNQVTTFTASDFGRTFAPNNSLGTDHAWGNTQIVVGGAVRGGRTYGKYPELTLGGDSDVGVSANESQGRWIPTTSVDQYAMTLLSWFGLSANQVKAALPNIGNFNSQNLGFV